MRNVRSAVSWLVSAENGRAVALGVAGGAAYLAAVLFVMHAEYHWFSVWDRLSGPALRAAMAQPGATLYPFGGVFLVGAVAVALLVRARVVLPFALVVLDFLVFVGNPHVGDAGGPLAMLLWPLLLVVFAVVAGVELLSRWYVRRAAGTGVVTRRAVVRGAVGGMLAFGLWEALPVWRVVPVYDPLPLWVENDDGEAHEVAVEITDERTGEVVFAETIHVEAGERVRRDDVITYVGRYRVAGELDDGTTDEYVLDADRVERLQAALVWIEGELGRFRVLGQGSGP